MQRRYSLRAERGVSGMFACVLCFTTAGLLLGSSAHADRDLSERANETARTAGPQSYARRGGLSDYQPTFGINYLRTAATDCQVPLPPVGAISPFPLALRLGAMVSPRLKFDGGVDATIPGLHLLPGLATRFDVDAIVSVNFGGVSTLVPVTVDQIYNLNLPISSRVYIGGGIGPYFGDVTRFGGKLIAGAEFSRLGLEGSIHFAGSGDALLTIQARVGL